MNSAWASFHYGSFVKICGITNLPDAVMCVEQGADSIGLLLEKSDQRPKRGSMRLPLNKAAELAECIRGRIQVFILVHTDRQDLLESYLRTICPDALQICEEIDPVTLLRIREKWPDTYLIHAVRVRPETTSKDIGGKIEYLAGKHVLDGVILDSAKGGSGKTHDWRVSAEVVKLYPNIPMLLAGGINPENADKALSAVNCAGIDVMTSVNSGDGNGKDKCKVGSLISAVKRRNE